MLRRRKMVEWPAWRYGPDGEAQQFNSPEEVPEGWQKKPQLQYEAPKAKPEICKETTAEELSKYMKVDPRWGKQRLWEELEKALGK